MGSNPRTRARGKRANRCNSRRVNLKRTSQLPSSLDEEVVELSDGDHRLHPDELVLLVHEQDVRHVDADLETKRGPSNKSLRRCKNASGRRLRDKRGSC